MILLRCKLCRGEVDIIGNGHLVYKKVRCLKCGFTNDKAPEVVIIKRKPANAEE